MTHVDNVKALVKAFIVTKIIKMNDNFTCDSCNLNAVMEGQTFFVTEGHKFTLLQLTALEALY